MSRAGRSGLAAPALVAFAANSLLCRAALGGHAIDPASFATLRVAAGAVTLVALVFLRPRRAAATASAPTPRLDTTAVPTPRVGGDWRAAFFLFGYVAAFAFAYVSLRTGTGALLLFGTVQATMIVKALRSGERPSVAEWLGLLLALGGLVYLVLPGLTAPPLAGSLAMIAAGLAWGFYSLHGRGSRDPLADTAGNFARALPLVAAVSLAGLAHVHVTPQGALLAVASGALASGLGYVLWYAALPALKATQAAVLQLAVPILAALGGVLLLGERVTPRLLVAMALILGGVSLAIAARGRWPALRRGSPRPA